MRLKFAIGNCRLSARSAWNVNRTSVPGLGANECVLRVEDVVRAHGIPPI
jgi:hypothetical protein